MSERKKLKIISSTEIMNTPMKKQRFIVDGIIYPGVHILSGDLKIVKSWMVLDMCLGSNGARFMTFVKVLTRVQFSLHLTCHSMDVFHVGTAKDREVYYEPGQKQTSPLYFTGKFCH